MLKTDASQASGDRTLDLAISLDTEDPNDFNHHGDTQLECNGKHAANSTERIVKPDSVSEGASTTMLASDTAQAEMHDTHAVFRNVSYCGEFEAGDPKSEDAILRQIDACARLWRKQAGGQLPINFTAPRHLNSCAIAIEASTEKVIFCAPVMTIIFCSRGALLSNNTELTADNDKNFQQQEHPLEQEDIESFFAFTCCTTTSSNEQRRFVCHVIRANSRSQTDEILSCFQEAFRRDPAVTPQYTVPEPVSDTIVTFCFEASVEIQERDIIQRSNGSDAVNGNNAGSYANCQVEAGRFFKFRRNTPKKVLVQLTQLTPESPRLLVEKCFGMLIAIGTNVMSQDFHLLDEVHLFKSGKQVLINAEWDIPAKKEFEVFCTEGTQNKQQNNRIPFKVAVDFVAVGMQAPLRFVIDTGARVLASNERSWGHAFGGMLGKKHVQEVFYVRAQHVQPTATNRHGYYDVISINPQSAITRAERAHQQSHKIKRPMPVAADDTTSSSTTTDAAAGGETDDEPLMSGFGSVFPEVSETEMQQWNEAIEVLRDEPPLPKQRSGSGGGGSSARKTIEKLMLEFGGIPQSLRRELWQRLADSYNARDLFDIYKTLSVMNCGCEAEILKDTSRTFPAHEFFRHSDGEGQEALFRLCKSYALYDPETGYHQSISFVAACLLLQMPEEQAFCLLVKIMYDYKQRALVNNEFYGLRLKYVQLERLVEKKMPHLHAHMQRIALEVHMFASQWFLTMFTAKFPLPLVYRILDLFLLEGEYIIPVTAFALLKLCQNDLMLKNFEESLKYFRVSLPKIFLNEQRCSQLVQLVFALRPLDKQLKALEAEFEKKCADEALAQDPLAVLRREYRLIMKHVAHAEHENDALANELITTRLTLRSQVDKLEDDNEHLQLEVGRMRALLEEGEQQEANLHHEIKKIKQLYRELEHDNSSKEQSLRGYKDVSTKLSSQLKEEEKKRATMMNLACDGCKTKIQQHFEGGTHDSALVSRSSSSQNISDESAEDETLTEEQLQGRELEAELARTKFALVDCQCRSQELEHQLSLALAEIAAERSAKNSSSWLQYKFNAIKQSIAAPVATTVTASSASVSGLSQPTSPATDNNDDTNVISSHSNHSTRQYSLLTTKQVMDERGRRTDISKFVEHEETIKSVAEQQPRSGTNFKFIPPS